MKPIADATTQAFSSRKALTERRTVKINAIPITDAVRTSDHITAFPAAIPAI